MAKNSQNECRIHIIMIFCRKNEILTITREALKTEKLQTALLLFFLHGNVQALDGTQTLIYIFESYQMIDWVELIFPSERKWLYQTRMFRTWKVRL